MLVLSLSKYLAKISISMLTIAPILKCWKLVLDQVCGITFIEKVSAKTSLTVRETPSIETEPFDAKYFINSFLTAKIILKDPCIFSKDLIML